MRSIEQAHRLSNGILGKVVKGERRNPTHETLCAIATALMVDPAWLILGTGQPPAPTGPVPPRTHLPSSQHLTSSVGDTLPEPIRPPAVAPNVAATVMAAVDAALLEAPADATAHQVLALAILRIPTGTRQT